MGFKGTKGELKLHEEPYANTNGFYVQAVSSEFDNNMLFANAYGHTKKEAQYNSKLISKSPELLELLNHFVDISDELSVPDHLIETFANLYANAFNTIQEATTI